MQGGRGRSPRGQMQHTPIHMLDDGCLMRILTFLSPLPDRFNAARVCRRWQGLALDRRMWLRVDFTRGLLPLHGVYPTLGDAIIAARPGDTILIASGGVHVASNIRVDKPLCLVGDGSSRDETVLLSPRCSDSALEFSASARVANLTIKAELGSCILHRKGCLTVESCALKCGEHPLDHLSFPIVSTADALPPHAHFGKSCVSVIETLIEGGAGAVRTSGSLVLQQVRVMYARAALFFWFTVAQQKKLNELEVPTVTIKA
ncbi:hypothetical protein O6H91_01G066200 [Diphasiastrum complanatum]|uniref:Uncharacterized protein n=1 Tax=Diphasiastrum complanatum TaxID=34168 RepID=A0ACC2ES33_DIPCM|nr:hypothetical protein O6H91_Y312400 [Diphasiastrum complanatum]KAJ7569200.1 hypothetical protein O6H91_01G066200 [Diphasiastrum complanatum]